MGNWMYEIHYEYSYYSDKSIRIFSHDYSRQSKYLDRPIIQFSYVRKDEDCDISCDNANHSVSREREGVMLL